MNRTETRLSAGLYVVATPIGSARDLTLRAIDVLAAADVIAAEDTRTARKLMEIHGIATRGRDFVAYHDHSGARQREKIAAQIAGGQSVAYVSEAGTPLVADPGYGLARAVIGAGLPVHAAPGASAVLAALMLAGLPTDRFAFIGFLPTAKAQRRAELVDLKSVPMTLVFYESPKRVAEMVADLAEILGSGRPAAVCRELTKKFEEVRRGSLGALAEELAAGNPRGEFVVVVGKPEDAQVTEEAIVSALEEALETMRVKDAATAVAGALGVPRREVYQRALEMGRRS